MTAEHRRTATVEIAFQTVTDRFVQQYARPASAQYHRQRSRRCRNGGEVYQRHPHRFFRPRIGTHVAIFIAEEILVAEATTATAGPALAFAVLFNLDAYRQANQRTYVSRQRAVSGRHEDQFINAGQTGGDFLHSLVRSTRHAVNPTQNVELLFAAHALQRIDVGIQRAMFHRTQRLHTAVARITHDSACRQRALLQRQLADLIGVGKPGFFAAHRAHANALVDVVRAIFNNAVF